jgi:hypothetical protein
MTISRLRRFGAACVVSVVAATMLALTATEAQALPSICVSLMGSYSRAMDSGDYWLSQGEWSLAGSFYDVADAYLRRAASNNCA